MKKQREKIKRGVREGKGGRGAKNPSTLIKRATGKKAQKTKVPAKKKLTEILQPEP
jgi:hypothetical protein